MRVINEVAKIRLLKNNASERVSIIITVLKINENGVFTAYFNTLPNELLLISSIKILINTENETIVTIGIENNLLKDFFIVIRPCIS